MGPSMSTLLEKPTQENRILKVLKDSDGKWISGRKFLQEMYISQFHARIWSLQKQGHQIEASGITDEFGFKSYRLLQSDKQLSLV